MAWTDPITWTTADVVTAAQLNTHIRDNENFLYDHHGCRTFKSATQTVTTGSTDVISWNSETYDTDAIHDTATNNSRFIVPSNMDGFWRIHCQVNLDADAAVDRRVTLSVRKNAAGASGGGTSVASHDSFGSTVTWACQILVVASLVAADYLELFFNSFTEDRVIQSGTGSSWAQMEYLGG